jgi:hypothetical protein
MLIYQRVHDFYRYCFCLITLLYHYIIWCSLLYWPPGAILLPVSNNTCIQELHNIHVDAHTIEIYRKNIAWISCVSVLYIYHHIYIYVYLYLLFFGWYLFVPHESASLIQSKERRKMETFGATHRCIPPGRLEYGRAGLGLGTHQIWKDGENHHGNLKP